MTRVDCVRVGEVLQLKRREVRIDVSANYEEIGVRSFGKGIFHKAPVDGASLGSKRVFRIEPGDLVISNVFAWEGAIAVASDAERGKIGSHRFMTFVPIDGRIDTSWAAWFFRCERGLELIREASPGSAGRNKTLAVKRFQDLVIPLPPLAAQDEIADQLDAVRRSAARVCAGRRRVSGTADAAIDSAIGALLDHERVSDRSTCSLGEIAAVNPPRARLSPDEPVAFVPMAAVSAELGVIDGAEMRLAGDVQGSYRQFRRGDILFARITPCMQNGKAAVFEGLTEYGYGSSEFHIIRAHDPRHTAWLHRFLRSRELRSLAAERMTGTAGQQRVPPAFLHTVTVPIPAIEELGPCLAAIDRLLWFRQRLHQLERRGDALADAIEPAVLNRVFAALN